MKTPIPFFLLYLSIPLSLLAQSSKERIIAFKGYVLSEDSVPVGDVHLINYRTLKIIITDSTGYFKTYLHEGDSLMINHLSLAPKVIHANANPAEENKIYVPLRTHMIDLVFVNEIKYKMEMKHAEKNITLLYDELERKGLRNPARVNTSDASVPFRMMPGLGSNGMSGMSLNVLDIVRLVKENRKENEDERIKKQAERKERQRQRQLKRQLKSKEIIQ